MQKDLIERFNKSRMENHGIREKLLKRSGSVDVEDLEKNNETKIEKKEEKRTLKRMSLFTPFCRVDKEKRLVSGIATNEALDSYGDIVRFDAVKKAMPDYMEFGNIREMHQAIAAGVIKDYELKEDEKALYITAKIVDDSAWNKVLEGVYKGFSIGGEIIDANPITVKVKDDDGNEHEVYTGGYEITEIKLIEISVVDRPANPEALITEYKKSAQADCFVPDAVFSPSAKSMMKYEKVLTSENNNALMDLSHLRNGNEVENYQPKNIYRMEKNTLFTKAWSKVCELFKSQGVDLEDASKDDVKVSLTRGELRDVVKDSVEKAVLSKDEGGVEDGLDAGEPKEDTDTKPSDSNEEKPAEADEAKADEPEAKAEGEEAKADDATGGEEAKADEAKPTEEVKTEDNAEAKPEDKTPDVVEAVSKLAASMKAIADSLEKRDAKDAEILKALKSIQKASGISTQSIDAELRKSDEEASFKGIFTV